MALFSLYICNYKPDKVCLKNRLSLKTAILFQWSSFMYLKWKSHRLGAYIITRYNSQASLGDADSAGVVSFLTYRCRSYWNSLINKETFVIWFFFSGIAIFSTPTLLQCSFVKNRRQWRLFWKKRYYRSHSSIPLHRNTLTFLTSKFIT